MIERVEVAKGPLSALYGANAFLATVNVITRGQTSGVPVIAEVTGRANMARGRPGFGGTLVGGYDEGERSLIASVGTERVDRSGLAISQTFEDQDPRIARFRPFFGDSSRNDMSYPTSFFGQFRTKLGSLGAVTAQGGVQHLDSMGEFQLNSVLTHRSRVALENYFASVRHEKEWTDRVSTAAWVGWSQGTPTGDEELYLTGNTDVAFTRGYKYTAIDGAAEIIGLPLDRLSVKSGVDFSYEPQQVLYYTETFYAPTGTAKSGDSTALIGATDTRNITLSNVGTYLQVSDNPIGGLFLTGNFRLDLPNLFPTQYSWRAAAAYKWSEALTTKLIAGRAYQTPSAVLLYGLTGFGSSNNVIGNRTRADALPLVPQVIQSIEAVTSIQIMGRFSLEASAYAQEVNDKIEFAQAGPHFQARNAGQQRNVGLELGGRLVYQRFSLQTGGSLQRSIVDGLLSEDPPELYPNAMVFGRLGVAIPEIKITCMTQAKWVGERGASQSNVALNNDEPYTLPSYATVDVGVSTLGLNFLGGAQTVLALSVKNLFDARYSEPGFGGFDIPNLGRTALLELRQSF
jgi:outer membrane receptor protein involved in Fe transport